MDLTVVFNAKGHKHGLNVNTLYPCNGELASFMNTEDAPMSFCVYSKMTQSYVYPWIPKRSFL